MVELTQQIINTTLGSINISLVIVLLGIGAILKHAIKSLDNNVIPIVMIVLGVIIVLFMNAPFDPQKMLLQYLVQGIASGYCAIIVHGKSKEIYHDFIGKDLYPDDEEQLSETEKEEKEDEE